MYSDAIGDIVATREAARAPSRDASGIILIFRYYNLLYYVERRFFPYGELKRMLVRMIYLLVKFLNLPIEIKTKIMP